MCGQRISAALRKRHRRMGMSNLETIEMLCNLVERQAAIIHRLVLGLEQERSLTEAEREMVDGTQKEYSKILGTEVPGDM